MFTQPFTAFRQDSHYGFARVTVYNATHTHVEFLYSDDGKSHFDFWFTKTGSGDEDGADEIEENQEGGEAVWGVDEVEWCELNGNEEVVDGWMCLGGARVPSQQPGDRPRLSGILDSYSIYLSMYVSTYQSISPAICRQRLLFASDTFLMGCHYTVSHSDGAKSDKECTPG